MSDEFVPSGRDAPSDEVVEIVGAAIRDEDGCGLQINGRRAFCDDSEADPEIRYATCACRENARAAILAYQKATGGEMRGECLSGRVSSSDEHSAYVPIETPPALVEWKRVVNDAYLLLADPRGDALWAGGVHEWLQRAVSLAERAKSADATITDR